MEASTPLDDDVGNCAHFSILCENRDCVKRFAELAISIVCGLRQSTSMTDQSVQERIRTWLAAALDESAVSQTVLARVIGLSSSAISRVLKGERQMSVEELRDALRFFDQQEQIISILGLEESKKILMERLNKSGEQYVQGGDLNEKLAENATLHTALPSSTNPENIVNIRPYGDGDGYISIPRLFLGILSDIKNLRWLIAGDDAMSPTFERSDLIIFDIGNTVPGFSGLTVIEDGFGSAIVRRLDFRDLQGSETSTISVMSDNARYESKSIRISSLRIVGRCIGIYKHAF